MGYITENFVYIIIASLVVCALGAVFAISYIKNNDGKDASGEDGRRASGLCEGCAMASLCSGKDAQGCDSAKGGSN